MDDFSKKKKKKTGLVFAEVVRQKKKIVVHCEGWLNQQRTNRKVNLKHGRQREDANAHVSKNNVLVCNIHI